MLVPVVPVQYKKPKDLDPGLLELLLLKIVPVAVVLHFTIGSIFLVGRAVPCRALLPEAKHWAAPKLCFHSSALPQWPWLTLLSRPCLGLQWEYANASPAYRIVAYTAAVVVPLLLFKYGWDWWDQRQRAHKQQMVCDKVRPYLPAGVSL